MLLIMCVYLILCSLVILSMTSAVLYQSLLSSTASCDSISSISQGPRGKKGDRVQKVEIEEAIIKVDIFHYFFVIIGLVHPFIHSFTHSLTHSGPVHTATFSYENGVKLLRFCLAFTLLRCENGAFRKR